ncbi:MAG: radical SAM protein [Thermodesulfovibrionales bacterium]|nr:radical SAM protein [Thermodesulfovibrionales bacterium]
MGKDHYVIKQYTRKSNPWQDKPNFLNHLSIELTERCNNDCIHCCINLHEDDVEAKKKELSTDQIKKVFSEAASMGCLKVTVTGGEPLLRNDFAELYLFARKLGLKVLLFTNATLINHDLVELFKQIPPLVEIEVTVYGMEKDSYEGVTRKKGSFEQAWRGIQLLQENKIPFVVKSVALPHNRKDLTRFKKWAAGIPWMAGQEPESYKYFGLRLRRDNFKKNALIQELRARPEEIAEESVRTKETYHKALKQFSSAFFKPTADKLFSCHGGLNGGCVDAYGNFQLCILLRHPDTVYDLKQGSLREGYETYLPRIRKIKATNPAYLNRCGACFLSNICQQCPGMSWIEHGDLDTPVDYICAITHTQARYLGIIGDTEKAWEVCDWEARISKFENQIKVNPVDIHNGSTQCRRDK